MDKHVIYTPQGVCAQGLEFDIVNGYIHNIKFIGGCRGNTTGVAKLTEGMKATEVIKLLKGVDCRGGNSCPHQLALAIEQNL